MSERLPKVHPRERVMAAANNEAQVFLAELIDKHGLTYGEVMLILGQLTTSWGRWAVREERATQ